MLKRAGGYVSDHRTVISYCLLWATAFFAVTVAFVGLHRVQEESNKTRCQVVALVATFTQNSQRSAKATIASPTASKQQKDAAIVNLAEVRKALLTTQETLGHPTGAACALGN